MRVWTGRRAREQTTAADLEGSATAAAPSAPSSKPLKAGPTQRRVMSAAGFATAPAVDTFPRTAAAKSTAKVSSTPHDGVDARGADGGAVGGGCVASREGRSWRPSVAPLVVSATGTTALATTPAEASRSLGGSGPRGGGVAGGNGGVGERRRSGEADGGGSACWSPVLCSPSKRTPRTLAEPTVAANVASVLPCGPSVVALLPSTASAAASTWQPTVVGRIPVVASKEAVETTSTLHSLRGSFYGTARSDVPAPAAHEVVSAKSSRKAVTVVKRRKVKKRPAKAEEPEPEDDLLAEAAEEKIVMDARPQDEEEEEKDKQEVNVEDDDAAADTGHAAEENRHQQQELPEKEGVEDNAAVVDTGQREEQQQQQQQEQPDQEGALHGIAEVDTGQQEEVEVVGHKDLEETCQETSDEETLQRQAEFGSAQEDGDEEEVPEATEQEDDDKDDERRSSRVSPVERDEKASEEETEAHAEEKDVEDVFSCEEKDEEMVDEEEVDTNENREDERRGENGEVYVERVLDDREETGILCCDGIRCKEEDETKEEEEEEEVVVEATAQMSVMELAGSPVRDDVGGVGIHREDDCKSGPEQDEDQNEEREMTAEELVEEEREAQRKIEKEAGMETSFHDDYLEQGNGDEAEKVQLQDLNRQTSREDIHEEALTEEVSLAEAPEATPARSEASSSAQWISDWLRLSEGRRRWVDSLEDSDQDEFDSVACGGQCLSLRSMDSSTMCSDSLEGESPAWVEGQHRQAESGKEWMTCSTATVTSTRSSLSRRKSRSRGGGRGSGNGGRDAIDGGITAVATWPSTPGRVRLRSRKRQT
eukprot:TRINITY_DN11927_c0_g1_i3.p1 TRINITY_DN11927_c0_g1~~TRINITY_DN11927_c0_g1_i3.p1  ORF type:complete len:822 (-),score=258.06 TRINITY_DN11927_c0_g1_i3:44-2509(-)